MERYVSCSELSLFRKLLQFRIKKKSAFFQLNSFFCLFCWGACCRRSPRHIHLKALSKSGFNQSHQISGFPLFCKRLWISSFYQCDQAIRHCWVQGYIPYLFKICINNLWCSKKRNLRTHPLAPEPLAELSFPVCPLAQWAVKCLQVAKTRGFKRDPDSAV